jgi:serine/threonine protein kinase
MLEVLSSAALNSLAIGQSPFGHSINIPRFDSFFTCHDDMEDVIDVYIVEELLDATFKGWEISHRGEGYDAIFKTMLWQCLYTLVMLGKMGWSHGDASFGNFMVKKVKPGYHVNNVDVGSATDWTFRLDGQEWKLKNLGYIAKITDFGFMQHFKDPKIKFFKNSWFESHRIPTDEVAAGADIGYFMISIGWAFALKSRRRMESMKVLFQDWFRLIKVKASDHMKLFDKLTAEGELKGFALESSRLDGKLEKHDVSSLLNSSYFDDVITH